MGEGKFPKAGTDGGDRPLDSARKRASVRSPACQMMAMSTALSSRLPAGTTGGLGRSTSGAVAARGSGYPDRTKPGLRTLLVFWTAIVIFICAAGQPSSTTYE